MSVRKKNDRNFNMNHAFVAKKINEHYAQIIGALGNGYMQVACFRDGSTTICKAHIGDKMLSRIWFVAGDIVLVNHHNDTGVCDIVHKYTIQQAAILRAQGQIPETIKSESGIVLDSNSCDKNDVRINHLDIS